MASQHSPGLLRTLRTPADSGPVSCLVAFPDGRHVASASTDNIRLWNTADYYDPQKAELLTKSSRPPFRIIAGHHGGTVSSMSECKKREHEGSSWDAKLTCSCRPYMSLPRLRIW
jgi:transcriptional activator SPT8